MTTTIQITARELAHVNRRAFRYTDKLWVQR